MRFSIEARGRIFVKGYWFSSFAKNMSKNISKNLSGKYIQKRLDRVNQSVTDTLKTASKKQFKNNRRNW